MVAFHLKEEYLLLLNNMKHESHILTGAIAMTLITIALFIGQIYWITINWNNWGLLVKILYLIFQLIFTGIIAICTLHVWLMYRNIKFHN